MNRREFGRNVASAVAGAAAAGLVPQTSLAQSEASGAVPFKLSIMLWTVFRGQPLAQRLEKVAEAGYHAVEFVECCLSFMTRTHEPSRGRHC
jgi:hypothetical protein